MQNQGGKLGAFVLAEGNAGADREVGAVVVKDAGLCCLQKRVLRQGTGWLWSWEQGVLGKLGISVTVVFGAGNAGAIREVGGVVLGRGDSGAIRELRGCGLGSRRCGSN